MTAIKKTDDFYDEIVKIINKSLSDLLKKPSITNGNIDLEEAISKSKNLLEKFQAKINEDVIELKKISEWDTFSIAFYGETSAGKSTLIETLRILLGDNEKLAEQHKFKKLEKDLGVDPHSLAALEKAIQELELQIIENKDNEDTFKKQHEKETLHQDIKIKKIKKIIQQKKEHMNWLKRLIFFFRKLDEEKQLSSEESEMIKIKTNNNAALELMASRFLKINQELSKHLKKQSEIKNLFEKLIPFQDGNIIGDGRSDFTLESHAYRFTANGQKFQLIDVPGIEGDEKQVMTEIDSSVKKAHAVFYVTRTAKPPGSGSDGQEGTIDKIKRQLGKQTEVWAIYNKSAAHPQVLQAETLINKNDLNGLNDMNTSLSRMLGDDTYKGYICLSAMPAFLASASCFVPSNLHIKSRAKFISAMSQADILKRSGMDSFIEFIKTEICQNFQKKIQNANLKKIRSSLQEGIDHMNQARDNFVNAAKKLEVQQKSASLQIDTLLSGTSQQLKRECHDELASKKSMIRTKIYAYIDSDQSNDDFKELLTAEIEELKTSTGKDLEKRFAKVFDMFKQEISEIVKKNQRNVDEILHYTINDPFSSFKLNFDADFKMDNGINVLGVISSLGGAAALVWTTFLASNPLGWTAAAALGAAGLIFGFYKAMRSFFSSKYKKEQQRKSADENINKVFEKLTEMLDGNLESASTKINEALSETKNQIRIPYEQTVNTIEALKTLTEKMLTLQRQCVLKQPS